MGFEVLPTRLEGPIQLQPMIHRDGRGFFAETFRADILPDLGIEDEFVQENHSRSVRGVIRGIHFTVGRGMAKLVRCARGAITDVLVDLRTESPTFGQWEAIDLDDVDLRMLYVPVGFGHGFCTISEEADVIYRCSAIYDASSERTLAWDDPDVGIQWATAGEPIVSERDAQAPRLSAIRDELLFEAG